MLVYSHFQCYCLHSTFNHMALVTFYDGRGDLSSCRLRLGCKPCKPCKLGEIGLEPRYKPEYMKHDRKAMVTITIMIQNSFGMKSFFASCFFILSPLTIEFHWLDTTAKWSARQNSNLIGADTNWAIKPILDLKYCRLWVLTHLNSFQVPFRRPELHLSFSLRATNPLNPPTAA